MLILGSSLVVALSSDTKPNSNAEADEASGGRNANPSENASNNYNMNSDRNMTSDTCKPHLVASWSLANATTQTKANIIKMNNKTHTSTNTNTHAKATSWGTKTMTVGPDGAPHAAGRGESLDAGRVPLPYAEGRTFVRIAPTPCD